VLLSISLIILQGMNPIFASALVPGWGELIQGERSKARAFVIVEGSIWLSYLGFNYFGNKLEQSARSFAIQHSGANPTRRDDDYFEALEDYLTSDDYNLEVERNASLLYPNDPLLQQEYIEQHGYFDDDTWEWDSLGNRTQYWDKRRSARENIRRARFMPGFAIINRIVSIIDVVVFAQDEQFGLDSRPGRIGVYYKF